MVKYYNPHNYPVSFTTSDGGRITLPPVIPGMGVKTIEGDYYRHLVERGTLKVFTQEVVKKNADMYRQIMTPRRKSKIQPPAAAAIPPPVRVTQPPRQVDAQLQKAADEPLKKDGPHVDVLTDALKMDEQIRKEAGEPLKKDDVVVMQFTMDVLEEKTIKDLREIIATGKNFGTAPRNAKKQDLMDLILEKQ